VIGVNEDVVEDLVCVTGVVENSEEVVVEDLV
jgi:hypothetical protein